MKTPFKQLVAAFVTLAASSAFAASGWPNNYDKALEQAKKEHKKVLLDFTGSDWCVWCVKLDKDIFSTNEFKEYAKQNLVLVEADFPQTKQLPKEIQEQNEKLSNKYEVEGFPTLMLLDADGKKLGQIIGYVEGGPKAFIAELEKLTKK